MNWLRILINKILKNDKTKLLEAPQITEKEKQDNSFKQELIRQADPEMDDKSGYKIIKKLKLREMV